MTSYATRRDGRSRKIYSPQRQRARSVRIIEALAAGRSRSEIAEQEAIGEHYLRRILMKLRADFGVPNDCALIAAAMRQEVIE